MRQSKNGLEPGLATPIHDLFTGTGGIAERDAKRSADIPLADSVNHALLKIWCAAPSSWFKKEAVRGLDTNLTAIKTKTDNAMKIIATCARPAYSNAEIEAERFARLKAEFAKHGHTLHQSGPDPVSYLAERWGLARHLPTLDDADKFLVQVGGGRHE